MNSHLANCYQNWKCMKLNWWSRTELKKAALMPQFDMVMLDDVHVFTSSWEPPWKSHYDLESCLQCTTQLLRTSFWKSERLFKPTLRMRQSMGPQLFNSSVCAAFRQGKMAVMWLNSKGLPKNVFKDCFHSHLTILFSSLLFLATFKHTYLCTRSWQTTYYIACSQIDKAETKHCNNLK